MSGYEDDDFEKESPNSKASPSKTSNHSDSDTYSDSATPSPKKKADVTDHSDHAPSPHSDATSSAAVSPASSPASSPQKSNQAASPSSASKKKDNYDDDDFSDEDDEDADPDVEKSNYAAASNNNNNNHSNSRNNNNNSNSHKLPPLPPGGVVSAAKYPGRQNEVPVSEYLDTSKALVKSNKPLTKPNPPRIADQAILEELKQQRRENRHKNDDRTRSIIARRENERSYLKAQYEFEREKKNAEKVIYQRERAAQWSHRLAASPLGVDLVADSERIEEEVSQREAEEQRRRRKAERHRRKIKNEIVVKALAEVPLLDEARRQKREMLEDEKRQRALRDVHRVEAVQARKLKDLQDMAELRQKKLETSNTRGPSTTVNNTSSSVYGGAARAGSQRRR